MFINLTILYGRVKTEIKMSRLPFHFVVLLLLIICNPYYNETFTQNGHKSNKTTEAQKDNISFNSIANLNPRITQILRLDANKTINTPFNSIWYNLETSVTHKPLYYVFGRIDHTEPAKLNEKSVVNGNNFFIVGL